MNIKILGTGCPKCKKLEELVRETIKELSVEAQIEKIDDLNQILSFGVMLTPALVIDGKVILSGRVPSSTEIKEIIEKHK